MQTTIEALAVVWPTSIPRADYEKALRLAGVMAAERPAVVFEPAPNMKPLRPRKRNVSQERVEEVRGLLETGPAAAQDLTQATGYHFTTIYDALRELRAVPVRQEKRKGPNGKERATTLYGLPKQRTP